MLPAPSRVPSFPTGSVASKRRGHSVRPGNHVAGGLLILTREPAAGVTAMQDLGPLMARVLLRSTP